jgi:hypothetical protein
MATVHNQRQKKKKERKKAASAPCASRFFRRGNIDGRY